MEELQGILTAHAERYPAMEPADAVKLIYQNEFGGGHLVRDEQAFRDYLNREYSQLNAKGEGPDCEDIGNGLIRVNLASLSVDALDALAAAFLESARRHRGQRSRFLEKLEILRTLTAGGCFAFDTAQLEEYLAAYAKAGYPMVSHSGTYRAGYSPAYRIVMKKLWVEN